MLKKLILAAAFFVIVTAGYSKENYNDIKIVINDLIKAEESFLLSAENAETAEDIIKTFNTLSNALSVLKSQMSELEKKYPELKDAKNIPDDLKEAKEKLESVNNKLAQTINDILAKFGSDEKVQKAVRELQKALPLNQESAKGDSKEKYSDVKEVMSLLIKAEEDFIASVESANSAEDIIKAVAALGNVLSLVKPQVAELEKKYPELKDDKNLPEELKPLLTKFETINTKFAQAMQTVMTKFGSNEKVQKAFQEMLAKMQ